MQPNIISKPRSSLGLLMIMVLAVPVIFTACNRHDRGEVKATAKDAYNDTKDAFASGWDKVRSHTYDKRSDFTDNAKALSSSMEARASKLRADYSDAKASASRKAAMAEFKNNQADYKQKVDALGNATAATWDSAKQNVIAAWDRMEASYRKAVAD